MSEKTVRIGPHEIGTGHRPFIIAEMSGNHNGDLDRALKIVDIIGESGAQALKLQTYTADTITLNSERDEFFVDKDHPLWGSSNLYKLYEKAFTPWEWHKPIFDRAKEHGLVAFSSAFDPTAVQFLDDLGVPAFKVASAELVDLPLIRQMAQTGKPIVMSTGSATLTEITTAVETARNAGCDQLILFACTASYPADPSDSNLQQIPLMAQLFDCVVGYSDHTHGVGVSVGAVALGASAIEKHVTTSREDEGVDSAFSLNPAELTSLVVETERVWEAIGTPHIGATDAELEVRRLRRSLYVTRDVKAGEKVSADNVRSVRPANGLPTIAMDRIEGWVFTRDVSFASPAEWSMFAPTSS